MPEHEVFWAVLLERSLQEDAVNALLHIAMHAGGRGYKRLSLSYMRTDVARNELVKAFLKETSDPQATLIMLDADHNHPSDILERLAAHGPEYGVVGALAFRRGGDFAPCAMFRGDDGALRIIAEWEPDATLVPCTVVGTGAIAIKRWVFERLEAEGMDYPYFRYYYPENSGHYPTEDVFFGVCCEQAGILHWVDMTLVTPHLTVSQVDASSWQQWLADHPDASMDFDKVGFQRKQDGIAKALESLGEQESDERPPAAIPVERAAKVRIIPAKILTRIDL